ncbi:MAG: tetratricopeptide repeat protein [Gemmataceae bacterium]
MPTDRIAGLAQEHFERGHEALREGRFRDAIESFSKTIAMRPDVPAAYRFRAAAYRSLNDRPTAITDLTEAIRRNPDDAQLRAERASDYLKQKCYDQAIADCDEAMRLDPGRGDVYGMRAAAHGLRGDTPAALADFEQAFKLDPENAHEYLVARGRLSMELDDYERAIRDATAALAVKDDHVPAYEMRAICRQRIGQTTDAEADFREILDREPRNFAGLLGLGLTLFEQKRWEESRAIAEEIIRLRPMFNRGHELLGMSLENLNRFDEAIAAFSRSIELNPRNDTGYHLRAGVYLKRGEWAKALAGHREGFRHDSNDPQAMNYLAWIWACCPDDSLRNGQQAYEMAIRACELTQFEDAGCLDTLAAAHAELGEFDKAIAFSEQAIAKATREEDRQEFATRLALFQSGQPYRLTPKVIS